tara:strand:+ start:2219 stop:2986 length:768 start_codon:yes stop_codon:yes gene_type:complete
MKSPLKNVNFKKYCLAHLKRLIPRGSKIETLFFFSGDLELSLSGYERFVHAHCSLPYVYEFWRCIEHDPDLVHSIVTSDSFKFEDALSFSVLQENWHTYQDEFVRAALFFLLNRCSSTGMASSGMLSLENYHPHALNALRTFKMPEHFHLSFLQRDKITNFFNFNRESGYILLPIGDFSYNFLEHGKSQTEDALPIDHKMIRQGMTSSQSKIMSLYNYRPGILDFFKDLNVALITQTGQQTKNSQEALEVVVTNF